LSLFFQFKKKARERMATASGGINPDLFRQYYEKTALDMKRWYEFAAAAAATAGRDRTDGGGAAAASGHIGAVVAADDVHCEFAQLPLTPADSTWFHGRKRFCAKSGVQVLMDSKKAESAAAAAATASPAVVVSDARTPPAPAAVAAPQKTVAGRARPRARPPRPPPGDADIF
jgi:hypothetical protein